MMRKWRTLATLSVGAAVGASASRLWSLTGEEEEEAAPLARVPLVPVPSVHASSELTVRARVDVTKPTRFQSCKRERFLQTDSPENSHITDLKYGRICQYVFRLPSSERKQK